MRVDFSDEYFMKVALQEAQKAFDKNEIPVGAVVTHQNQVLSKGHNLTETLKDPTAHAEMQAITAASEIMGGKYLHNCTLYSTLEPCVMCAGAAYWSQLERIVFGAYDEKKGYSVFSTNIIHPKTKIQGGIFEKECKNLLNQFFIRLRSQ